MDYWMKDAKVIEIIHKYYPEATSEDIELLFFRMSNVGCSYIATINTIVSEYNNFKSEAEFREKFGFNLYELVKDENGKLTKRFNYEYLFLDYYLSVAKNQEGYNTIEEANGNASEQYALYSEGGDGALSETEFNITGMGGGQEVFAISDKPLVDYAIREIKYLKEKGIEANVYGQGEYKVEPGTKAHQKLLDTYEDGSQIKNYYIDNPVPFTLLISAFDRDVIEEIIKSGGQIVVSSTNFPLYYSEDINGNGELDDLMCGSVSGHAMTVTGLTSNPDKIIVSSWGQEYIMDISDIHSFTIYHY